MSSPQVRETVDPSIQESVLIRGDLKQLTAPQKLGYYKSVCESLGLNPLTQPFAYITLNGKEMLYARREATEQLRKLHRISIQITARETMEGCYIVTAKASMPDGRCDESTGAVGIDGVKGEARANAMLKAETKAKRRVTLSICGMGMLDESEVDSIPSAVTAPTVTTEAKVFGTPKVLETLPTLDVLVASAKAAEKKTEPADFIERGMVVNFNKSFREALPLEFKPQAEIIRHAWLAEQNILDGDGNPSANVITKQQFEDVRERACKFAKEYK